MDNGVALHVKIAAAAQHNAIGLIFVVCVDDIAGKTCVAVCIVCKNTIGGIIEPTQILMDTEIMNIVTADRYTRRIPGTSHIDHSHVAFFTQTVIDFVVLRCAFGDSPPPVYAAQQQSAVVRAVNQIVCHPRPNTAHKDRCRPKVGIVDIIVCDSNVRWGECVNRILV